MQKSNEIIAMEKRLELPSFLVPAKIVSEFSNDNYRKEPRKYTVYLQDKISKHFRSLQTGT